MTNTIHDFKNSRLKNPIYAHLCMRATFAR